MRAIPRPAPVDVLLAVVLTGLILVTVSDGSAPWPAYPLAALTTAPLVLRQHAPVVTMAVVVAALAAYSLLGYGGHPDFGLLVGMFTVATLHSRKMAAIMFLTAVAALAITRVATELEWASVTLPTLQVIGAWVLGEGTRRWSERARRAEQTAAVAEERVRAARELHDVAAHHLAVVSLQADVAQHVIDTDVPTARDAITTIGATSREALTDMRRLLDALGPTTVHGQDHPKQSAG